ncbi:uncharacterized protein [Montipora foliosa]|uniref:uncharacterized protein n=1 Tax=Montipora foliosa TaxID=591990 RepID=UPI0035F1ECFD
MEDENSQRFNAITAEEGATTAPVLSYSLPRSLGNISNEVFSSSEEERCGFSGHDESESRRREQRQNIAGNSDQQLSRSCHLLSSGTSSVGAIDQSLVDAFSRLFPQRSCAPHQEKRDVCTRDPEYNLTDDITSNTDPCHRESELYDFCLFKRRIIERDDIEYALYIIPVAKFREVFPKIKKDEALVYHGTEFPLIDPARQNFISVHKKIQITGSVRVTFELVQGEKFAIVSAPTTTVSISEIRSKSENRVTCGFAVEVIAKCGGGNDEVFEDIIKVILQSGDRTVHFFFPVAYYEASVSPWLYNSLSVTSMPEEDREALRSCHVELLQNIGDVMLLCDFLYQHKILESDDLENMENCKTKRERNAAFLDIIQRRGNVLDYVIKVMQGQRENQHAAVILQRRRRSGANPQRKK